MRASFNAKVTSTIHLDLKGRLMSGTLCKTNLCSTVSKRRPLATLFNLVMRHVIGRSFCLLFKDQKRPFPCIEQQCISNAGNATTLSLRHSSTSLRWDKLFIPLRYPKITTVIKSNLDG